MKIVIGCLGILALGLLSLALAKHSASTTIAWVCGYFAAVAITNIDKHIFGKWPAR